MLSWAGIDYYGRWKALHYKSKRFFAPILLSADIDNSSVELFVINDTINNSTVDVEWTLIKADGTIIETGTEKAEAKSLSSNFINKLDFSKHISNYKSKMDLVFNYKLLINGEVISDECQLFIKSKHFKYLNPNLSIEKQDKTLLIRSDVYTEDIYLDVKKKDILFSDNYFSTTPNTKKVLTFDEDFDLNDLEVMCVNEVH